MEVLPGRVYKHFKGKYSLVLYTSKHSDSTEDNKIILVNYFGLDTKEFYSRPIEDFVEQKKNADGEMVDKFTLASDKEVSELVASGKIGAREKSLMAVFNKNPNSIYLII